MNAEVSKPGRHGKKGKNPDDGREQMYRQWLVALVEQAPYGTKSKLAKAMGIDSPRLARLLSGERKMSIEEMERAASFFGVQVPAHSNATVLGGVQSTGLRIPVYGQVVGGVNGDFVMNGVKIDEVLAPPSLANAKNAYAVYVAGDSMEPRYFPGETLFVDPDRRFKKGDFVVAQIRNGEEDAPLAFVKRFKRWDAQHLILEQFNPPEEMEFPADRVVSVHVIVGSEG